MNRLLIAIIAAIVLAFSAVFAFEGAMAEVYWVGEFFLKSLKMIIVPTVVFSMISGVTGLGDVRKLGRLGGLTVLYFAATTFLAVALGSILVNLIQPGVGLSGAGLEIPEKVASKGELGLSDIILSFVSNNIFDSMARMDMLPIIVFSLVFGGVLTTLGEKGRVMIDLANVGNEVMMKVVHLIMWMAPIGIFGLVAGRFGKAVAEGGTEAFREQLEAVGLYMITVLAGLAIHAFVILPLLLVVIIRRNPLRLIRAMGSALLTAFSTASSAATLPLTIECAEENAGINKRVVDFVIPLGATINMNGTALYEAVAVIFIAQVMGIDLSLGQQILIILTASLAAVGAAGIPEAGLVTMVIVLKAVGLPLEGAALILSVDWLLDRFRTAVNVWGDVVGATIIEKFVPLDKATFPHRTG